ncbi:hypothetical protein GJ654_11540 [Rhodoblastus acidophilus]|uniref:Glycosyl transferase n=1 Tax=Rhodoblastus acidophilus TaxID=1074 RepID=A0A6N8DQ10_RHOAC|nr:glycosyltransferase [Rhodoblastus acidophilus]MCW2274670.1 hypothetical protein [Rhodoblastus acidophilus]MTV31625.1 hypothetical protein [Rhodoblastus acidophilus]
MTTEFNFFWYGGPLTILNWVGVASFVKLGHTARLWAYEPLEVPPGVLVEDANEIIPKEELFLYMNPVTRRLDVGPFSDLFRFKLLWMRGGWYSDTDVICLRPEFPVCDYAWAQIIPEIDPSALAPSQIRFPRHDPMIEHLYKNCLESSSAIQSREHLGPHVFSKTLAGYPTPASHWGSADEFYPIRWIETFKLWLPEFRDEVEARVRSAAFVSTMNSMHAYMDMADKMPPRGSWLDEAFRKLAPEKMVAEHYTCEETLPRIRAYFIAQKSWAFEELAQTCGVDMLARLGLESSEA